MVRSTACTAVDCRPGQDIINNNIIVYARKSRGPTLVRSTFVRGPRLVPGTVYGDRTIVGPVPR